MASASESEDELAHLSGAELVIYLSNTYRRADFEAVARILKARDRRNARVEAELRAALADLEAATSREMGDTEVMEELEAALEELDAVREKYQALLDAYFRPRLEVEEMPLMVQAASPDAVHQDESRVEEAKGGEMKEGMDIIDLISSDEEEEEKAAGGCEEEEDEEDTESLSQRFKRRRGELESGKGDVRGQRDSVGTLGNDQQKSSSVRIDGVVATTGKNRKIICTPEHSKLAAFVQESPLVKTDKFDGEMPRTMLLQSQGLLGRIPIPNKTPMLESSAKCGNKEVGAEKCASLPRLREESMITRDVVPFEPCNENTTYVQVKREMSLVPSTVTSKWVSEGDMLISLFDVNNLEISMQALCALYRQGKLATEDKRIESRAKKLAEFLLGGDLHGPVKRTAEEVKKKDVTNAHFLQQVTMACSEQLFAIFRNKKDPYFC